VLSDEIKQQKITKTESRLLNKILHNTNGADNFYGDIYTTKNSDDNCHWRWQARRERFVKYVDINAVLVHILATVHVPLGPASRLSSHDKIKLLAINDHRHQQ